MKQTERLILAAIPVIAFSGPAHAYIDPGSGTLIVQGLIGSFVAIATVGGLYLQRFRAAIGRAFRKTGDREGVDRK